MLIDNRPRRIPKGFVEKGLRLAETGNIFGIPLEELSRDELLAVAAMGWDMYRQQLEITAAQRS